MKLTFKLPNKETICRTGGFDNCKAAAPGSGLNSTI